MIDVLRGVPCPQVSYPALADFSETRVIKPRDW